MKKFIGNIPAKIRILLFFSAVCLLFTGIILVFEHQMRKEQYDQQVARRWSREGDAVQISAFFSENAVESEDYFLSLEHSMDQALQNASITAEHELARLWVWTISKMGNATVSTQRTKMELQAVGVSEDFFIFHPQKLIAGATFSKENMMKDGIIIDRETAWQLFGSSDVVGMQVMVGDVPHYVTGVIERGTSRLEKAAGLEKPICFLSLESLKKYGTVTGGFTYEAVLPNPVKGFGLSTVQTAVENLQENVVVVENSTRFQLLSLLKVIKDYGIRSMSLKGVVYPYWENIARGQEDVLAFLLVLKMILLILPVLAIIVLAVSLWKHRTFPMKRIVTGLQDKLYEAGTKRVQKKKKRMEEKR